MCTWKELAAYVSVLFVAVGIDHSVFASGGDAVDLIMLNAIALVSLCGVGLLDEIRLGHEDAEYQEELRIVEIETKQRRMKGIVKEMRLFSTHNTKRLAFHLSRQGCEKAIWKFGGEYSRIARHAIARLNESALIAEYYRQCLDAQIPLEEIMCFSRTDTIEWNEAFRKEHYESLRALFMSAGIFSTFKLTGLMQRAFPKFDIATWIRGELKLEEDVVRAFSDEGNPLMFLLQRYEKEIEKIEKVFKRTTHNHLENEHRVYLLRVEQRRLRDFGTKMINLFGLSLADAHVDYEKNDVFSGNEAYIAYFKREKLLTPEEARQRETLRARTKVLSEEESIFAALTAPFLDGSLAEELNGTGEPQEEQPKLSPFELDKARRRFSPNVAATIMAM